MFFDIGHSSRKPVLEGGPKDPLGCRSFDQRSPLPPLPQRVPTLPLPPTPKFHLPGGRRHALVLCGCVKKPRTEKRFDRGPQREPLFTRKENAFASSGYARSSFRRPVADRAAGRPAPSGRNPAYHADPPAATRADRAAVCSAVPRVFP